MPQNNISDKFEIVVKQVIIHKLVDGVFYSSLICERDGIEEIVDARTSDAIALALRFDAPIFTYKNILDKAGIFLKAEEKQRKTAEKEEEIIEEELLKEEIELQSADTTDYKKMSLEELKELLSQAVSQEDYEKAARIRDEISKRK